MEINKKITKLINQLNEMKKSESNLLSQLACARGEFHDELEKVCEDLTPKGYFVTFDPSNVEAHWDACHDAWVDIGTQGWTVLPLWLIKIGKKDWICRRHTSEGQHLNIYKKHRDKVKFIEVYDKDSMDEIEEKINSKFNEIFAKEVDEPMSYKELFDF